MNLDEAIKILDINGDITVDSIVKKQYYKMALRFHPDKNHNDKAAERFRECNEAYVYLQQYLNVEVEDINHNYLSLIKKCIRTMFPDIQWNDIFLDSTVVPESLKIVRKHPLKYLMKLTKTKH